MSSLLLTLFREFIYREGNIDSREGVNGVCVCVGVSLSPTGHCITKVKSKKSPTRSFPVLLKTELSTSGFSKDQSE